MEKEPIDITNYMQPQLQSTLQEVAVDYGYETLRNPYQRSLWDFVDIDRNRIEEEIAEQKKILEQKKEDDPFVSQRKLFELRYLNNIREEIARDLELSIDALQKVRGYAFDFDGWNIWRIQSDPTLTPEEKHEKFENCISLIRFNWATSLRERYGVNSSTTKLYAVDNKLRSELWPDEPLENVYIRGAAVRESGNNAENTRDKIENYVFQGTQKLLLEKTNKVLGKSVPVGTRVISLSPPSIRTKLYPDNYVDIMELKEDSETKKRYVSLTRYKGTFSHEQYASLLRNNKPYRFLESNKSLTLDEKIKDNAFIIFPDDNMPDSDTLCSQYFGTDTQAFKDREFQQTVLVACKPAINEYIRAISKNPINWLEVHACFENVYKLGDETVKQFKQHKDKASYDFFVRTIENTLGQQDFLYANQLQVLGSTELATVNAGCGETGSYKKKNMSAITAYLSGVAVEGILAELGIDDKEEDGFLCPNCKKSWVKGNQCKGCGITQEEWAEKTGINCGGSAIAKPKKKEKSEEIFLQPIEKPKRRLPIVKKQEQTIFIKPKELEEEAA